MQFNDKLSKDIGWCILCQIMVFIVWIMHANTARNAKKLDNKIGLL
jgi:hypothetical protein